ncbi:MAG: hypothetical protein HQK54_15605, partial [Oligoflexales bacterium]|nr:hypothetical protein [Oligoflexales bacterium]
MDCREISSGDISAKDILLSGESIRQKLVSIEEKIESARQNLDAEDQKIQAKAKSIQSALEVELTKITEQVNADRTFVQDSRRALMTQADKDRSDNFLRYESLVEKANEDRSNVEKERVEIYKKIDEVKEDVSQREARYLEKIQAAQAVDEDGRKLIMEKLSRYRQNNNAAHTEAENRLTELEGLFSSTEPGDTSLCLKTPGSGQDLALAIRDSEKRVKKIIEIKADSGSFPDVNINGKLYLKDDSGLQGDGSESRQDVLGSLRSLENRFARQEMGGDSSIDILRPLRAGDRVALGLNVSESGGKKDIPLIVGSYDASSGGQKVGINTPEPSSAFHVHGESRFEDDLQIEKNLYVTGDSKFKSSLQVQKNMLVSGDAKMKGSQQVQRNFYVLGDAKIGGNVTFQRGAEVHGETKMKGDLHVLENIVTYTNGEQDGKYLKARIEDLEIEVASLKRSIAELKQNNTLKGNIENIVRDYCEIYRLNPKIE